jgi:putative transposase
MVFGRSVHGSAGLLPENWTIHNERILLRWKNLARRIFSMKRSRFTDQQIAFGLQQAEQGTQVTEVTRKMGISEQTSYRWKKKFGGLMPSEVRKLRQLEEENARLRRLVADLSLDKEMLQEVIRKKL